MPAGTQPLRVYYFPIAFESGVAVLPHDSIHRRLGTAPTVVASLHMYEAPRYSAYVLSETTTFRRHQKRLHRRGDIVSIYD